MIVQIPMENSIGKSKDCGGVSCWCFPLIMDHYWLGNKIKTQVNEMFSRFLFYNGFFHVHKWQNTLRCQVST